MDDFKSLSDSVGEARRLYNSLGENGKQLVEWRSKEVRAKMTSGACYAMAKWLDNLFVAGTVLGGSIASVKADWVAEKLASITGGNVAPSSRGVLVAAAVGSVLLLIYKVYDRERHLKKAEGYSYLESLAREGYDQKRRNVATKEAVTCTPEGWLKEKWAIDKELPLSIANVAHGWSKYKALRENLHGKVNSPYNRGVWSFLFEYYNPFSDCLESEMKAMDYQGRCQVYRQVEKDIGEKQ